MSRSHIMCVLCALCMSCQHESQTNALFVGGTGDNCILSFVIPRDKMKSSCQSDEKVSRQLSAVEMKVNMYRQQVSDMQLQLNKQRQLNSEKIEALERQIQALSARTENNVALGRRLAYLENSFQKSSTDVKLKAEKMTPVLGSPSVVSSSIDNVQSILPNLVRSMIQSEVSEFFGVFTKNVEVFIHEQMSVYNRLLSILPRSRDGSWQQSEYAASSHLRSSGTKGEFQTEDVFSGKDVALLETYKKVKAKLNYTGDKIAKQFGSFLKNITNVGYTAGNENSQIVIAKGQKREDKNRIANSERVINEDLDYHKEPFSGESTDANDTSLDDPFTSHANDVSGSASSRINQNSKAHGNSTEAGLLDNDGHLKWKVHENREQYYNKITEAEGRLKDEVTTTLYTSLAEVLHVIEEQKTALETKIIIQDNTLEQLNKDFRAHREEAQNVIAATNLRMQLLSGEFKDLTREVSRIESLETLVNEIKNNTAVNRTAMLTEQEEQNKRFRKLERLTEVYPQSLEHYRNETKHEYREVRVLLDKELNALRTFTTTLQNNFTSSVNFEINRLNNSHLTRFQELDDRIREYEDALMNVQTDIQNTEKMLENRPKRSDRDFADLQETVSDISIKQKDFKRALERIEQSQTGMNTTVRGYLQEVSALKTEVKLNYDEWLPLAFHFDSSRTDCFGDQYIRRTRYSKVRLVGVVLCSPNRYKIFLSTSLHTTFWNIGDGNGMGDDHCEFVGGNKDLKIKLSPFKPSFEAVQGYTRNQWGQEPVVSYLNAIKPSPHWYECGVKIP